MNYRTSFIPFLAAFALNAYAIPPAQAETPQEQCASQGKRYYERTQGTTFLGIPVSSRVVWSGCLTDGEAAMSGAGSTQYSQPYVAPAPTYQAPRPIYCSTQYGRTSCF
jgi:hypothetical protein